MLSASNTGADTRDTVTPVAAGDVTSDPLAAPDAGELSLYHPIPYRVDPDEAVTCPHCQLKDDTDATFCDQCGTRLAGRDDVTVGDMTSGEPYAPEGYDPDPDETVQCPDCEKRNDPDASYCDQCGVYMVGRPDVNTDGPYEEVDNVACGVEQNAAEQAESAAVDPDAYENVDPDSHRSLRNNLVRVRASGPAAPAVLLRDATAPTAGQSGSVMFGYFSTFNDWYEIDDWYEGTFLEQVAPGAYAQTMTNDRAGMKVLYDHGFDPQLGNKPLGPIQDLREDKIGAYFEVPLLDTDYNRNFLLPALRGQLMSGQQVGSLLGSSFRFMVTGESWDRSGTVTPENPKGLPLRTITEARVLEFGPVTFPANQSATSGVRSGTGRFIDQLRHDPLFLARYTERAGLKVVEQVLSTVPADGHTTGPAGNTTKPEDLRAARVSQLRRRARAALTLS